MRNKWTMRLSRFLAVRAAKVIASRPADFEIGNEAVCLSRWWIIPRNPIFNIYLHAFWRDDDDRAMHDHPFASVSLALGRLDQSGRVYQDADAALWETYLDKSGHEQVRRILSGELVYRSAKFSHRLIVPEPGVMTLFVTGPRTREWGFWCGQRWVHWKVFTGYADGRPGSVGRGCE